MGEKEGVIDLVDAEVTSGGRCCLAEVSLMGNHVTQGLGR